MADCEKCGFPLPEEAIFCPNCGATVKKVLGARAFPNKIMNDFLKVGLFGTSLSIIISLFSAPIDLYFIPPFVSSVIAIYLSRSRKIENAMLTSMMIYFLSIAIISVFNQAVLYAGNQSFADYLRAYPSDPNNRVPTLLDVLLYALYPITAFIAAYLGSRLVPKTREEFAPAASRKEEQGPGGVIYFLKERANISILSRLIKFKYHSVRSCNTLCK